MASNEKQKNNHGKLFPNIGEAGRHLKILDSRPNAQFTFQTFPDCSEGKKSGWNLVRILHGTLALHAKELTDLNRCGAGIFVTVNETNGKGRKAEDIVAIRAAFADNDDGSFSDLPLESTLIIESKNGDHAYWSLVPGASVEDFIIGQKAIAHKLHSDPSVCDPPRVMRLAGFFHLKNPQEPFLVRIKSRSNAKHTIDQILSAFPPITRVIENDGEGKTYEPADLQKFSEWALNLPKEEGSKNPFGGRNFTLLNLIREGLGCGIPETSIREIARNYCRSSGEDIRTADEMLKRQSAQHRRASFESYFIKRKDKYTASEVASHYLSSRAFDDGDFLRLRYYRGDFFRYQGERYTKVSRNDLRTDVMTFLQESKMRAVTTFSNNVVANIEGKTLIFESVQTPSFLSQPEKKTTRMIGMKNGILDVGSIIDRREVSLISHSPDFFSTSCLPFMFDSKAKCPTWIQFLKKSLPDRELRDFLQEWFGYNLVFDTQHHIFVLLIGEGANGKSVICVVLRALLGDENVSGIGLEQFNPTRTFPLAATDGKLANIIEEIGDVDKVSEGILKDFSSGGVMTVERKHQPPFQMKPTARLTFASNVLPRFKDRSSGLWRRMTPIPFNVQILNPAEQDKRLVSSEWWKSSGELPGIMNWAIRGLLRLHKQGHFSKPKVSERLLTEFQAEANPAATFLEEHCSVRPEGLVPSIELYRRYSEWMKEQNNRPLGSAQFTREVKKKFPHASLSQNAKRHGCIGRSREWAGFRLVDDEHYEKVEDNS
jgi:P4 family phage/plasmid primase-like protien